MTGQLKSNFTNGNHVTLQRKEDFNELLPIKMSNSEISDTDPYK